MTDGRKRYASKRRADRLATGGDRALVALQANDLVEVPDGLRVMIRRREGQGIEIAIPRGYRLRPVEALQAWLTAAEISSGPVFRSVAKGNRVLARAALRLQRLRDRQALRRSHRPRCPGFCRTLTAGGLRDECRRGECAPHEDRRANPAPLA
jgi:hypothetical protein